MNQNYPVPLSLLPTGVPGLDAVLGGGLPEYSFNLISGTPGAGKTTLVHQLMFAIAAPTRPALYFTVMGEPPLKLLRHQQQFAFFDPRKVGNSYSLHRLERGGPCGRPPCGAGAYYRASGGHEPAPRDCGLLPSYRAKDHHGGDH